ncbi:meiotic recombination protein Rec10 [Schizosaccharomyces japonicus yFS275]|uniref:Meiotic recombination protein Rec10 n=1 Tax=Schizosaccharomyces japonicus (strain yFS275 / FY16936) TaxID=402676 RepID=B6K7N2_SCHJY|nr:meiotic recombination protein Rec10 [Schizosaccharomyces japonicus yFS275]EEB09536.1 meiotic recombination protein Rec10 [Schizosaccharomyces japonicus yFS275]
MPSCLDFIRKTQRRIESNVDLDIDLLNSGIDLFESLSVSDCDLGETSNVLQQLFQTSVFEHYDANVLSSLALLGVYIFFTLQSDEIGETVLVGLTKLSAEVLTTVKQNIGPKVLEKALTVLSKREIPALDQSSLSYSDEMYSAILTDRLILQLTSFFAAKCEPNKVWLISNRKVLPLKAIGRYLKHRDFACRFLAGLFIFRFSTSDKSEEAAKQNELRVHLFVDSAEFDKQPTMQMFKPDKVFETASMKSKYSFKGHIRVGGDSASPAMMTLEPRDFIVYRKKASLVQAAWTSIKKVSVYTGRKFTLSFDTSIDDIEQFTFTSTSATQFRLLQSTLGKLIPHDSPTVLTTAPIRLDAAKATEASKASNEQETESVSADSETGASDEYIPSEGGSDAASPVGQSTLPTVTETENVPAQQPLQTPAVSKSVAKKRPPKRKFLQDDQVLGSPMTPVSMTETRLKHIQKASSKTNRKPKEVKRSNNNDAQTNACQTKTQNQSSVSALENKENMNQTPKSRPAEELLFTPMEQKSIATPLADHTNNRIAELSNHIVKKEPNHASLPTPTAHESGKSIWTKLLEEKPWKRTHPSVNMPLHSREIDLAQFDIKPTATFSLPSPIGSSDRDVDGQPRAQEFDTSKTLYSSTSNDDSNTIDLQSVSRSSPMPQRKHACPQKPTQVAGEFQTTGPSFYLAQISKHLCDELVKKETSIRQNVEHYHERCRRSVSDFQHRQQSRFAHIDRELDNLSAQLMQQLANLR